MTSHKCTHAGIPTKMKDSRVFDVVTYSFYNFCLPSDTLSTGSYPIFLVMVGVVHKAVVGLALKKVDNTWHI